jgi:hypothetical protein
MWNILQVFIIRVLYLKINNDILIITGFETAFDGYHYEL